jgi:hypothetical protein
MGAYFSVDSLLDATHFHVIDYVIPQVENPVGNMLTDTVNWMLVSGSFTAIGGERFMTIGNFHNPANTNTQAIPYHPNNVAYYYIDDVSVVNSSGVGVAEINPTPEITLYPNPCWGQLTVNSEPRTSGTLQQLTVKEIKIYDVLGELVNSEQLTVNSKEIDVSKLHSGLYFAELLTEKGVVRRKFVKE